MFVQYVRFQEAMIMTRNSETTPASDSIHGQNLPGVEGVDALVAHDTVERSVA